MTPKVVELVNKLVNYHAEWAWAVSCSPGAQGAVEVDLDEVSATALSGIEETLKDLYWLLPRLCPYCGAVMAAPEMHPDQLGHSTAGYDCRCGAMVTVIHTPPEEDGECCSCCGSGLNTVFPCPTCGEMICNDCSDGVHICDPDY